MHAAPESILYSNYQISLARSRQFFNEKYFLTTIASGDESQKKNELVSVKK
jgi:hypothetical protein